MREEIRKRIDTIRRGEVPEGYKKTKAGIVPEEWAERTIKDLVEKIESGVSVNCDETQASEYRILKTSAVKDGVFNVNESKAAKKEDYDRLRCSVKEGCIIICRSNTPLLVGMCGYVEETAANIFLPDVLWQLYNKNASKYNFKWLNYLLSSNKYRDTLNQTAAGTSSSMKKLSRSNFETIKLAVPSITEQITIAEIISAFDERIINQQKLIGQKQSQKKWLMQNLLTGKKRIDGFDGEWREVKLGDVLIERKEINSDRKITLVKSVNNKIGFVSQEEQFGKKVASEDLSKYKIVSRGCIAYNPSRINVGSVALYEDNMQGIVSPMYVTFITNELLYAEYLIEYMNSNEFYQSMKGYLSGSVRASLAFDDLCLMKVSIPDVQEQLAIVSILKTVDKEIQLLQQQFELYKQEKKAIMQLLLTGIVRVNELSDERDVDENDRH